MILFVSQWYPSDNNEFYAPFIKEHLLSMAEEKPVKAITGNLTEEKKIRVDISDNIENVRIPLNPNSNFIYNILKFNILCICQIFNIRNEKFDLVVFNVFTSVLSAIVCRMMIKSRTVFIEHWSFWVRRKIRWLSLLLFFFDEVFVVSKNVKESFSRKIRQKTKVIENVVDDNIFNFTSTVGNDFIFIGRLENIKRIDRIINAFYLSEEKDSNLIIIGSGSERDNLMNLVSELRLDDRVEFLGSLEKRDIASRLKNARGLLLFSETENKPCVICESHYVGLPVLSNGIGGVTDMVDKTNGFLVMNDSVESYACALKKFQYIDFDRESIRRKAKIKYSRKSFREFLINGTN